MTGIVEVEFHFLCECQTYSALREDLSQLMKFVRILKIWNLEKSLAIY